MNKETIQDLERIIIDLCGPWGRSPTGGKVLRDLKN
jgi:hypothetical protein